MYGRTYGLGDLRAAEAMREDALRDAAISESFGRFEEADGFLAEAEEAAFYIAAFRSAGISEEFPGGEYAVIGVTILAYDDDPWR